MTRDAFPPLRELPAFFVCSGLVLTGLAFFANPPVFCKAVRAFFATLIGG